MTVSGIHNPRLGIPETRKSASRARKQGFRGLSEVSECAGFKYEGIGRPLAPPVVAKLGSFTLPKFPRPA
jgi:hypothetical protein